MLFIQKWDFLEPTAVYLASMKHRMLHETDTGINIRLRKHLEEVRYDDFCSSEIDEPVSDYGDAVGFIFHS